MAAETSDSISRGQANLKSNNAENVIWTRGNIAAARSFLCRPSLAAGRRNGGGVPGPVRESDVGPVAGLAHRPPLLLQLPRRRPVEEVARVPVLKWNFSGLPMPMYQNHLSGGRVWADRMNRRRQKTRPLLANLNAKRGREREVPFFLAASGVELDCCRFLRRSLTDAEGGWGGAGVESPLSNMAAAAATVVTQLPHPLPDERTRSDDGRN